MKRVQIFQVATVPNAPSPYRVKWRVAGRDKTRAFKKKALAEKFQRDLHSARDRGEHFSSVTGEPETMIQTEVTFATCASEYVANNYANWQPASRRSTIQALAHSVLLLVRRNPLPYSRPFMAEVVRKSLLNPTAVESDDQDKKKALMWLRKNSIPLQDLRADLLTDCLLTMSKTLDTKETVAGSTQKKRRQALDATLTFGAKKKYILSNPLSEVTSKIQLNDETLNPKEILSPKECRELQAKVASMGKQGLLVSVFIACMWLAGLRPSEVAALRPRDIHLDPVGSSEIVITRAIVEVGKAYTDDGSSTVTKQPKARRRGHSRTVPIPTELVKILEPYLRGIEANALLFPGPRSKDKKQPISLSSIEAMWGKARTTNHKLYDLRHANATMLLYSGLNVAEVATLLGHSIEVCSRVYLGVIKSQQRQSIARVNSFLESI
jgi:integrase